MLHESKLRDYQKRMANFVCDVGRGNLWSFLGSGKTVSTLTAIDRLMLCDLSDPVLIIAPLRVAQSVWPEEPAGWSHLKHLKVVPIVGNEKQRLAALRTKAPIYSINFENVVWLVELFKGKWPFKMVICDESALLKGFRDRNGSVRAAALAKVAHTCVRYWINLTGGPAPNGLIDLYGQQYFVDKGKRLGATYGAFFDRWFEYVLRHFDDQYPELRPKDFAEEQIKTLLSDCTITLKAEDYLTLPPVFENVVKVDLPEKAMRHYREMEKKFYTELAGHPIEAVSASSKSQKLLQFATGAAYIDENATAWHEVHDAKIQALEDIVLDMAGEPLMVAYHFRSDLERLLKAFPKARHLDKDPQTIKDWNAGKIPMLLTHPQSAGHGLSLQHGGCALAFFSIDWNLGYFEQVKERLGPVRQLQSGYARPVYYHYILARNTIDEVVMRRLQTKDSVQQSLLNAMRNLKML